MGTQVVEVEGMGYVISNNADLLAAGCTIQITGMKAVVADAVAKAVREDKYALIVVNFANGDMVGHTGNMQAAIKAIEAVDEGVKKIAEAADEMGAAMLITADHGNSDQLFDPEANEAHTRHTMNPVEVVIYGKGLEGLKLREGGNLGDIAPTVLQLMGLKPPAEMTGKSLIA
jgi:2,3-bisphosphoglycerate-independent phosphoglycerate mutase